MRIQNTNPSSGSLMPRNTMSAAVARVSGPNAAPANDATTVPNTTAAARNATTPSARHPRRSPSVS